MNQGERIALAKGHILGLEAGVYAATNFHSPCGDTSLLQLIGVLQDSIAANKETLRRATAPNN